jgi:hypothetical protein
MHMDRHLSQKLSALAISGVPNTGDFSIFIEKRHRLGLPSQFQRIMGYGDGIVPFSSNLYLNVICESILPSSKQY